MGADDKIKTVLDQYDINIFHTYKFGGALFMETDKGLLTLKQRKVSENRIIFENDIKTLIKEGSGIFTDKFLRNKDGFFVTEGVYGETYTLRTWFQGEECDLLNPESLHAGAEALGKLHRLLWGYNASPSIATDTTPYYVKEGTLLSWENENLNTSDIPLLSDTGTDENFPEKENPYIAKTVFSLFNGRITEMKKLLTYLKKLKRPGNFEASLKKILPEYINRAESACNFLKREYDDSLHDDAVTFGSALHGSYSGHNILSITDGTAILNFDKSKIGPQVYDLYHFLRKVSEKNNRDFFICRDCIDSYLRSNPLSDRDINLLFSRMLFPEKFWKAANMYFNGKKNWIPARIEEKLTEVYNYKEMQDRLVKNLISYYL